MSRTELVKSILVLAIGIMVGMWVEGNSRADDKPMLDSYDWSLRMNEPLWDVQMEMSPLACRDMDTPLISIVCPIGNTIDLMRTAHGGLYWRERDTSHMPHPDGQNQ